MKDEKTVAESVFISVDFGDICFCGFFYDGRLVDNPVHDKDRAEKLIIGNTDTIYKKTLENEKLRILIKKIVGDAIASVNADEMHMVEIFAIHTRATRTMIFDVDFENIM